MRELSIEKAELVNGGPSNNCSNIGNGLATAGFIVAGLALATGPVGWLAIAGYGIGFGSVVACQLGIA